MRANGSQPQSFFPSESCSSPHQHTSPPLYELNHPRSSLYLHGQSIQEPLVTPKCLEPTMGQPSEHSSNSKPSLGLEQDLSCQTASIFQLQENESTPCKHNKDSSTLCLPSSTTSEPCNNKQTSS